MILSEPLFTNNQDSKFIEPILSQSKSDIEKQLKEQAKIKRDLNKSRKEDQSTELTLKRITRGDFNVFKATEESEEESEVESEDGLRLIQVGSLSVLHDIAEPKLLFQVDVPSYQKKRRRIEEELPGLFGISVFSPSIERVTDTAIGNTTDTIVENITDPAETDREHVTDQESSAQTIEEGSTVKTTVMARVNEWHAESDITRNANGSSSNVKIYEMGINMIPIFSTSEQAKECDKISDLAKKRNDISVGSEFRKSIDCLNLTLKNYTNVPENPWAVSGKLQFLKELLDGLTKEDFSLIILTESLGEECYIHDLVNESLGFPCTRVGNILDDQWAGEYGVFVKTKKSKSALGPFENGSSTPNVDLILCLDITIENDLQIFSRLTRKGNEKAHVLWLVSVGSLEERMFRYLHEQSLSFSKSGKKVKDFLTQDNQWQTTSDEETLARNRLVALNLCSWLIDHKGIDTYQYRSTIKLPFSKFQATIKPSDSATDKIQAVITTQEQSGSDMDTGTDEELETPSTTSTHVTFAPATTAHVVSAPTPPVNFISNITPSATLVPTSILSDTLASTSASPATYSPATYSPTTTSASAHSARDSPTSSNNQSPIASHPPITSHHPSSDKRQVLTANFTDILEHVIFAPSEFVINRKRTPDDISEHERLLAMEISREQGAHYFEEVKRIRNQYQEKLDWI
ncbi:hypothetical protein CU098_007029, partial [Rhizopus stolonifer]